MDGGYVHVRGDTVGAYSGEYGNLRLYSLLSSRIHRKLRKCFKEDIVRDLMTSSHAQAELEAEWKQLQKDREDLRVVFPKGAAKVHVHVWSVQALIRIQMVHTR